MSRVLYLLIVIVVINSLVLAAPLGEYSIKIRIIENEWVMFDNCESRRWAWTGNWSWNRVPTELTWGKFFGRDCLQVTSTDTKNAITIWTYTFPPENWSNVELVRMDVYVEFPNNTADLKFEPKDKDGTSIESLYYENIPPNQWVDCGWNIDQSKARYQNVSRILLIPDNLGSNSATFYFDNLRLIMTDGTTYYWDLFDTPKVWTYAADAYAYYENNVYKITDSAITWMGSTSTVNAGRIFMRWDGNKHQTDTYAKVESENLGDIDFSRYQKVRIDVLCSTTTAKIAVGFWDGNNWDETSTLNVSSTDTYHTLEFNVPRNNQNFNWSSVNNVSVLIKETDLVPSGEIYIDNIKFYLKY
ncbi:MAG: hypothetical protein RMJ13_05280 [Elusimicrobiota bacterium]|nr:hypothetical protein [Elusimicrobiota bacterium]